MNGAQKVLSRNGCRMANCFCCLSQNAMVCLAHCCQKLQQKSWKTARLFLQDRDQDQMFKTKTKTSWSKTKTKTKTKTFIFVLEVPRDQDPGLKDYITAKTTHFSETVKTSLDGTQTVSLSSPCHNCISFDKENAGSKKLILTQFLFFQGIHLMKIKCTVIWSSLRVVSSYFYKLFASVLLQLLKLTVSILLTVCSVLTSSAIHSISSMDA